MQIYIALIAALGVISASLIAGFFSYSNIISSKENKVSEFRLSWIDGLREEIADYTSAVQELARINAIESSIKPEHKSSVSEEERKFDRFRIRREALDRVVKNISKIHMRLNPVKVTADPESDEAKLYKAVIASRDLIKDSKYAEAITSCADIRDKATPLLKSTWVIVRDGEVAYNQAKKTARIIIILLLVLLATAYLTLGVILWDNLGIAQSSTPSTKIIIRK